MTFEEAANYRVAFGKYRGERLDSIAESDDGLRYLDWLRGSDAAARDRFLRDALTAYFSDEVISREIKKLLGVDD